MNNRICYTVRSVRRHPFHDSQLDQSFILCVSHWKVSPFVYESTIVGIFSSSYAGTDVSCKRYRHANVSVSESPPYFVGYDVCSYPRLVYRLRVMLNATSFMAVSILLAQHLNGQIIFCIDPQNATTFHP